jgi:ribose/xylose/arabinose/galactoside ABC-type transport system permease subunit
VRVTDVYTTPSVVISIAVLVVAFVVLHYSRFGRTVYAVGGNESSARLMGLRVDRTKISVYVISGLFAGIAGLLFAFYTATDDPVAGIGYKLDAIAAVVIGGTLLSGGSGYVLGSVLGVLVLATIYAYMEFDGDLNTGWTRVMIGVLALFFIVLRQLVATRRRR